MAGQEEGQYSLLFCIYSIPRGNEMSTASIIKFLNTNPEITDMSTVMRVFHLPST